MANTPEIHVAEHTTGEGIKAKRVGLYAWDASTLAWVRVAVDSNGNLQTEQAESTPLKFALDDATTAGFLYIGTAPAGTATSSAAWRVVKMPTSPLGVALSADGNMSFDNIWDNRASLTYS